MAALTSLGLVPRVPVDAAEAGEVPVEDLGSPDDEAATKSRRGLVVVVMDARLVDRVGLIPRGLDG